MRLTEFERAPIAGGQRLVLAAGSAMPHRTYGMNHMSRREQITAGDFRVACRAAAEDAAFGPQLRPGGAMYRTVDASAAEQRTVRGVDDGVNA
jgi:hypothetical protein